MSKEKEKKETTKVTPTQQAQSQMSKEQASEIIKQVCAKHVGSLQEHTLIQKALSLLL